MRSEYYTKFDNNERIEFRMHPKWVVYRSIRVFINYSILYIILFLFLPISPILFVSIFAAITLLMFNYIGKILHLSIAIDLTERTITSCNLRSIIFKKPTILDFENVRNLLIKARPMFGPNYTIQFLFEPLERSHDKIIAQNKNQKDMVLFLSNTQENINEITYKISQHLNCPVFVEDDER